MTSFFRKVLMLAVGAVLIAATCPQVLRAEDSDEFTSRTMTIAGNDKVDSSRQDDFTILGSMKSSPYKTEVSGWYDEDNLWITIRAYGRTLPELSKAHVGRDTDVWMDDSVEFFFAPNEKDKYDYWHVIANPAGGILDEKNTPAGRVRSYDIERLRVSILYDYSWWQVNFIIPFESIGRETPKPGEKWRVNFTRFVPSDDGGESSTWSPYKGITFHDPRQFGTLIFEGIDSAISFSKSEKVTPEATEPPEHP